MELVTVDKKELKATFDNQIDMINGVIEYAELVQDVVASNNQESLQELARKSRQLVSILSEESIRMILNVEKTFGDE